MNYYTQTQTATLSFIPKIEAISPEALTFVQPQSSERVTGTQREADNFYWSPLTAGPYLVPVTRWVE
jgi:hypothetical protein